MKRIIANYVASSKSTDPQNEYEYRKNIYLKRKHEFETLGEDDNNDVLSREDKMNIAKAEMNKVAPKSVKSAKDATFKNDKRLSTIDASVTFSNFVLDSKGKLHSTSDLLKGYSITKDTSFICPRDEYSLVEIYSDADGQHILQCTHCQTKYAYEDDDLESFQEI